MRIAFVSDAVYPWSVGGIDVMESTEARELAKMHDVHFFSLRWPGMREEFTRDGVRFHTAHRTNVKKFYRHGRRSIREAIAFSFELLRLFRYRFDVVQVNEFPVLHLALVKAYCMLTGCKLVLDIAEVWDRDYWVKYLGRIPGTLASAYAWAMLRCGDAYIANSSETARRLERAGIPKSRIRLFAPVLDDAALSRVKTQRKTPTVMFAGRLIKEKRLDKWLNVAKKTHDIEGKFHGIIVGNGPEESNVRSLIDSMDLGDTVELRRFYKAKSRLYRQIRESAALLNMSEREGLSMIVLESLALGTPVILPRYSPIPKEVKGMCIVADERHIPALLARMLNRKRGKNRLRSRDGLATFSISKTNAFYSRLFYDMEHGMREDTHI